MIAIKKGQGSFRLSRNHRACAAVQPVGLQCSGYAQQWDSRKLMQSNMSENNNLFVTRH
jgi:hypothetical protein